MLNNITDIKILYKNYWLISYAHFILRYFTVISVSHLNNYAHCVMIKICDQQN